MTFSGGIEIVAHKVLVSFCKCFGNIFEVVGILSQPLKVRMLGLIPHTPVPPKGANPRHGKYQSLQAFIDGLNVCAPVPLPFQPSNTVLSVEVAYF